jgi:hypothetical protein
LVRSVGFYIPKEKSNLFWKIIPPKTLEKFRSFKTFDTKKIKFFWVVAYKVNKTFFKLLFCHSITKFETFHKE